MHVGSAIRTINCEIGDDLSGQLHRRPCERIRDNLEASFLYLKGEEESVLLVGLDLAGLFERSYVREVTAAIEARTGGPIGIHELARDLTKLTGSQLHGELAGAGLVPVRGAAAGWNGLAGRR